MKNSKKNLLISAISSVIGMIIGVVSYKKYAQSKIYYGGNLHIDKSEADENERMFLELDTTINELKTKNTIVLKVINKNYL